MSVVRVTLEKPMKFTCKQLGLTKKEVINLANQLNLTNGVEAEALDNGRIITVMITAESSRVFNKIRVEVEDVFRALMIKTRTRVTVNDSITVDASA